MVSAPAGRPPARASRPVLESGKSPEKVGRDVPFMVRLS